MTVQDLLVDQVTSMVFVEIYLRTLRKHVFSSICIHKIVTHMSLLSFTVTATPLPPSLYLPIELSSDFHKTLLVIPFIIMYIVQISWNFVRCTLDSVAWVVCCGLCIDWMFLRGTFLIGKLHIPCGIIEENSFLPFPAQNLKIVLGKLEIFFQKRLSYVNLTPDLLELLSVNSLLKA